MEFRLIPTWCYSVGLQKLSEANGGGGEVEAGCFFQKIEERKSRRTLPCLLLGTGDRGRFWGTIKGCLQYKKNPRLMAVGFGQLGCLGGWAAGRFEGLFLASRLSGIGTSLAAKDEMLPVPKQQRVTSHQLF